MTEIIKSIINTPIPTIFIIVGILLLFLAMGVQFSTKIVTTNVKSKQAWLIGFMFLTLGLALHLTPILLPELGKQKNERTSSVLQPQKAISNNSLEKENSNEDYKNINVKEKTTTDFIKEYYSDIKNIPYSESWSKLSSSFQEKTGYASYVEWWDKEVSKVFISNIKNISSNKVQAELIYQLKNSKTSCSMNTFTLIKNQNSWLINDHKYTSCKSK